MDITDSLGRNDRFILSLGSSWKEQAFPTPAATTSPGQEPSPCEKSGPKKNSFSPWWQLLRLQAPSCQVQKGSEQPIYIRVFSNLVLGSEV